MSIVRRMKHRWHMIFNHGAEINRRVMIENYLLRCSQGKKPPPTPEVCKWLALRLGTPKERWGDYLKNHPEE
jgi:hypothetical protein